MTQLTVSLEDITPSALQEIKKAIALLRGVVSVKINSPQSKDINVVTKKAIEDAENGDTIKCNSMDDYLKLVRYGVQD